MGYFLLGQEDDSVALIENDTTLTYRQLRERSELIARLVPKRALVLFLADNTMDSVCLYVGFLEYGIVPLMTKRDLDRQSFDALVKAYHPGYAWVSADYDCPGRVIYSSDAHSLKKLECGPTALNVDLALLLATSGSTGSQKYVRLSYANVYSNASSISQYLDIKSSDRAITTLPLSYSYGLSIINSHLISGASIVLTERTLFDREFWDELRDKRVSSFGGVPYTYQMLKRLRFERMDLPSLRYITQAGGRLGESLHKEFAEICRKKEIDFFVMYGQTEGTARLSYLPPEKTVEKIGSIGVAIPGGSFELLDANGAMIDEPDVPGELCYRGPNVSLGYAADSRDLIQGDECGGLLHTGDIAQRDSDGFYYIVGRMKRFLKIFGNRVNLDEVEQRLLDKGFVAACSGKDDEMTIYTETPNTKDVQLCASELTGLFKNAFNVKYVEAIPRNESGKILYSKLEA